MSTISTIIGTRPEIIKMAPVINEIDKLNHEHILIHSGQHYDLMMDEIFFKELNLRNPDHQFEIGDLPPHRQIASTIDRVGDVVSKADIVIVQGDTNTTLAGAILANKLEKPSCHVEAGIRSFDKTMPEEVNRILTDQLSTLLFAPTNIAKMNLENENICEGVHVVGNSVVDALIQNIEIAKKKSNVMMKLGFDSKSYFLVTFHRAENADNRVKLKNVLIALSNIAKRHRQKVLFPIHPRTQRRVEEYGLEKYLNGEGLQIVEPVGYFDMLILEKNASMILTDSGGLQEEACILNVPCVTLRENTERPETLEIGCNILAGTDEKRIEKAVMKQFNFKGEWKNPYGDGTTGKQIAQIINKFLSQRGRA